MAVSSGVWQTHNLSPITSHCPLCLSLSNLCYIFQQHDYKTNEYLLVISIFSLSLCLSVSLSVSLSISLSLSVLFVFLFLCSHFKFLTSSYWTLDTRPLIYLTCATSDNLYKKTFPPTLLGGLYMDMYITCFNFKGINFDQRNGSKMIQKIYNCCLLFWWSWLKLRQYMVTETNKIYRISSLYIPPSFFVKTYYLHFQYFSFKINTLHYCLVILVKTVTYHFHLNKT